MILTRFEGKDFHLHVKALLDVLEVVYIYIKYSANMLVLQGKAAHNKQEGIDYRNVVESAIKGTPVVNF